MAQRCRYRISGYGKHRFPGFELAASPASTVPGTVAFCRATDWPFGGCGISGVLMRTFPVFVSVPTAAIGYLLVNLAVGPVTVKVIKETLSKQSETNGSAAAPETT